MYGKVLLEVDRKPGVMYRNAERTECDESWEILVEHFLYEQSNETIPSAFKWTNNFEMTCTKCNRFTIIT